jgi:hypothetical protein
MSLELEKKLKYFTETTSKAKINQKKMLEPKGQSDQSMVKLSVLKR